MAVEILENTLLKLLVRRGTDSDRRNIVLTDGELGYTTDTERLFVGNSLDKGGVVVGNKYQGAAANLTTLAPAVTGDYAYETDTNELKVVTAGTGASLSNWTVVANKITAGDKTLNIDNEVSLIKLSNSLAQLVEFYSLLNQFKLWEDIYRLLIHNSLDKTNLNLELDDSYVDFSPLLSIKGAVGIIQKEVIEEIQMSIVKEGWFLDVYKQIEDDFRKFSINKVLRIDENILDQIDSETTGFSDKDSVRYLFHEFLEKGFGRDSLKYLMQDNVKRVIQKKDSTELFSEYLNSGESATEFINEIKESDSQYEREFDQNIWSNFSRVFEVKNVDRLKEDDAGSSLFAVDSGSPIQRVRVRTDNSANVKKSLINNISDDNQDLGTEEGKAPENPEDY